MVLGWLAALFFAVAFIFHGAGFASNTWLDWQSFMLLGLVCLALHAVGVGSGVIVRRSRVE